MSIGNKVKDFAKKIRMLARTEKREEGQLKNQLSLYFA